jgi:hypothetical protein
MHNLQLDKIDAEDLWVDYWQVQHTQWLLSCVKLDDKSRQIYEKEYSDIVINAKLRVWKICKI